MQIHEITQSRIDEGLLDLAKKAAGGVKGAVQGYQQSRFDRTTQQSVSAIANKALKIWNNYARTLKASTSDPNRYTQLYRQALAAFTQKNLLRNQTIETVINRAEITQLIDAIADAESNPQQQAQLFGKLVQQAALSQPDVSRGSQALTKVISTAPAIIQYKNINYAQNQQGDWANQTTGRVPDESFQAFLDQELAKAGVSL